MELGELESKRGYVVGAAGRLREKLGLKSVSDADQIANIHRRKGWEYDPKDPKRIKIVSEYVRPKFTPRPKKGK